MEGVRRFLAETAYQWNFAVFYSMPSSMPIADWLSTCCGADTYLAPQDKFGGPPSCERCRRTCDVHLVRRVKGERVV